jgi:hypothetical protein
MAAPTPIGQGMDETPSPVSNAEPEPGKNNPFACNVCKRNYSRVDHLARYVNDEDFLGVCVDRSIGTIDPVRYAIDSLFLSKSDSLRQIHVRSRSFALLAARPLLERKCFILSGKTPIELIIPIQRSLEAALCKPH